VLRFLQHVQGPTVEADLISYILADAGVGALVDDRVHGVVRPQGSALPAVTLTRISGGPEYADDGDAGIGMTRMQIDCWSETYTGAKQLQAAVFDRLSAVRDVTQGATTFIYITLEDARDLQETGSGQSEYLHRVSLDFMVWSNT
jgi:hypothetical protein